MASVYSLIDDAIHTEEDIVAKYTEQEFFSKKMVFAAILIQKHFRGYLVRKRVKIWNKAALLIQKVARGWLIRYHLPDFLHECYDHMCIDYYNQMACKLQSTWTGHSVRKQICIEDLIKEREAIMAINNEIRSVFRTSLQRENDPINPSVVKKVMKILFNRHHLLRTYQLTGIFSNQDSKELSELEKIIKSMKWKDYMHKLRKCYNKYSTEEQKYEYMFEDKKLREIEDMYRLRDRSNEVDNLKSNFIEKEEFITTMDPEPYKRPLASSGKYVPPITDIVREADTSKNICHKDFDLYVLKKFAKETNVPPYYIDFWHRQCQIHAFQE